MLIVSETRYVPTAVNMIVLQGSDGKYYYLHRSLYDQCVVLRDLYSTNLPSYYKFLGVGTELSEQCKRYAEAVPEPLDILAPFLTFVSGVEELETIEEMCGALSSMSMSIDFRRILKVPTAVRQSVRFSLSVREEYRIQWDRFFSETPTLEDVSFGRRTDTPAPPAAPAPPPDPEQQQALNELDALLSGIGSSTGEEEEEEPEEEEEQEPKPRSGFDLLRGLK